MVDGGDVARAARDRGARHVLVGADALRRNAFCHIVRVVACGPVHVRLECPRRDRRDVDVILDQLGRHAPGQVDHRGLARGVGIGFPGVDEDAVDRGDIDDLGGPFMACRRAQRLRQRLGQEEHRLDVEVHHLQSIK